MSERERFEKWISSPPYERSVWRYPEDGNIGWPGQYRNIDVQLAWEAWQEADLAAERERGLAKALEVLILHNEMEILNEDDIEFAKETLAKHKAEQEKGDNDE